MRFSSEKEMQAYCLAVLQGRGLPVQAEVICGNGIRADLVTADTVYELKLELDREGLYQACGQGQTYCHHLRKPKLVLVGHLPIAPEKARQAMKIAESIQASGVRVSFLEQDSFWQLRPRSFAFSFQSLSGAWSIAIGVVCGVVLMVNTRLPLPVAVVAGGLVTGYIEQSKRERS